MIQPKMLQSKIRSEKRFCKTEKMSIRVDICENIFVILDSIKFIFKQ